jgi:tRNA 2-selenouridine synthase
MRLRADAVQDSQATGSVARPSRPAGRDPALATVAELAQFDEIIDVRSESEYAEDHIPGAINCPVLDDEERARVGTLYKQVSSFDAKKLGAALVSANIARHLRDRLADRPRNWHPLVYCWRGGSRSGALAHVLQQIGWRTGRLDGGYKAYRRAVVAELAALPQRFTWLAVCGLTGTGKSRLLRALAAAGAQVLDLEALAAHRGSVLGNLPDAPQPSQKMFESLVWKALHDFDAKRPIFVEAESKKIGSLRVPDALIDAMWRSECVELEAPMRLRVEMLKAEYAHFIADTAALCGKLDCLAGHHGQKKIDEWKQLARDGRWDALTERLLAEHYDPAYTRSTLRHYPALPHAFTLNLSDASDATFDNLAALCDAHAAKF